MGKGGRGRGDWDQGKGSSAWGGGKNAWGSGGYGHGGGRGGVQQQHVAGSSPGVMTVMAVCSLQGLKWKLRKDTI